MVGTLVGGGTESVTGAGACVAAGGGGLGVAASVGIGVPAAVRVGSGVAATSGVVVNVASGVGATAGVVTVVAVLSWVPGGAVADTSETGVSAVAAGLLSRVAVGLAVVAGTSLAGLLVSDTLVDGASGG